MKYLGHLVKPVNSASSGLPQQSADNYLHSNYALMVRVILCNWDNIFET